jgi:hypothetical protein
MARGAGPQDHMMMRPSKGFDQLKPLVGEWKFSFSFVRATNLASPTAGHMHHLTVALQDHDHFSEAWTWNDNGKERTEVFHYTRKS